MRERERGYECLLVSQLKTLNGSPRFIDDEESASLSEVGDSSLSSPANFSWMHLHSVRELFDLGAEMLLPFLLFYLV